MIVKDNEVLFEKYYGRFETIDDCGHMMNMKRPEEFNNVIFKFIKQ